MNQSVSCNPSWTRRARSSGWTLLTRLVPNYIDLLFYGKFHISDAIPILSRLDKLTTKRCKGARRVRDASCMHRGKCIFCIDRVSHAERATGKKGKKKAIVERRGEIPFSTCPVGARCPTGNNGINDDRDVRDASVPWKENASACLVLYEASSH